jgi:hypothetical protein
MSLQGLRQHNRLSFDFHRQLQAWVFRDPNEDSIEIEPQVSVLLSDGESMR